MNNSPGKTRQPRERNSILKKYYGISPNAVERTNPLNIGKVIKKKRSHHYQPMWLSLVTIALTVNISLMMITDDPTFDAVKYFAKLVKEQPLNGLIKNDNVIVSGKYGCVLKLKKH